MADLNKILKRLYNKPLQPLRMRHDYGFMRQSDLEDFNPKKTEILIEKLHKRAKILYKNCRHHLSQIKYVRTRMQRYPEDKREKFERDIERWRNLLKRAFKDYNEVVQMIEAEVEDLQEILKEIDDKKVARDVKRIIRKGEKFLKIHNDNLPD